jgi:putative ABC transport system permease protein
VSYVLAKRFGWKIGDQVPLISTIWTKRDGNSNYTFEIVGIFDHDPQNSQATLFLFNQEYIDEARSFGRGTIGWYIVRIADPTRAAQISQEIDNLFRNSPDETKTQTEKENAQNFLKQLGDISFIINGIVGAVFFTLLFLIGNTMLQSARERIPEFAVLKAVGFSDTGVLAIVLAETFLLCVTAAGLGLLAAVGMFPALSGFIGIAYMPGVVIVAGIALAAALALITGLPPALRIQRLAIIDALAGR